MSDNTDLLYWIGVNLQPGVNGDVADNFNKPTSWFDVTTGTLSSIAPTAGNTLVFGAGEHDVFAGENPAEGGFTAGARQMVALSGANVLLSSTTGFAPQSYTFNSVVELPGATVSTFGSLSANEVVLERGATLQQHQFGNDDNPSAKPSNISELINHGGNFVGSEGEANITLGAVASYHPEFVQNYGGGGVGPFPSTVPNPAPTTDTGGFAPGESVIPFSNGLYINLGTITHGSHLDPVNIALLNGLANETATATGNGFTADLVPIPTPTSEDEQVQVGTFAPDTSKLGVHTEHVTLTGAHDTQTLLLTDKVV
jgi:hypothetical protein